MTKQSEVEMLATKLEELRDMISFKPNYVFQRSLYPSHGIERWYHQKTQIRQIAKAILDSGYVHRDRLELDIDSITRILFTYELSESDLAEMSVQQKGMVWWECVNRAKEIAAAKDEIIKVRDDNDKA